MPFDFEAGGWVRLEPLGIAYQRLPAFVTDGPAILTEKHVAQPGSRRSELFCAHIVQLPPSAAGRVGFGHERSAFSL